MRTRQRMETFVVRVWAPHAEGPEAIEGNPLHGVVEHVRSGGSSSFNAPEELVDFLRQTAAVPPPRPGTEGTSDEAEVQMGLGPS